MPVLKSPRRVVITGQGLISPLGDSPEAFWQALVTGQRGLGQLELFAANGLSSLPVGEIKDFEPQKYFGDRNYRPLDRNSRLATAASKLALTSAGLLAATERDASVGLVLGTMFGSVRTIAEFDRRGLTAGPNYVKPLDFANSVINAPAGQTVIWHHLTGVNSTITGGPTAGVLALVYAADLIRAGRAEVLLAGGSDELCYEALLSFSGAGLLHSSTEPRFPVPFARGREGLALGEGAALLVLEEEEHARRRGAQVIGEVVGHGSAFDASRGRSVADGAAALERAIRLALADAGARADQVGVLAVAASGSVVGDLAEALALVAVLGEDSRGQGVVAVKAHLGETLGASGGFQAIAALASLEHHTVPGLPGGVEVDGDIRLPLSASPTVVHRELGLVTALGGDGQVAAVLIRRAA